jgi:hypothetical protein
VSGGGTIFTYGSRRIAFFAPQMPIPPEDTEKESSLLLGINVLSRNRGYNLLFAQMSD